MVVVVCVHIHMIHVLWLHPADFGSRCQDPEQRNLCSRRVPMRERLEWDKL